MSEKSGASSISAILETEIETDGKQEEESFWDASSFDKNSDNEGEGEKFQQNINGPKEEGADANSGDVITDDLKTAEKLKIVHDRIKRLHNRVGDLSTSLRQVHQDLKGYSYKKDEDDIPLDVERKKSAGDIGITQTDPLEKPKLTMIAERIGDSVGCQTVEEI